MISSSLVTYHFLSWATSWMFLTSLICVNWHFLHHSYIFFKSFTFLGGGRKRWKTWRVGRWVVYRCERTHEVNLSIAHRIFRIPIYFGKICVGRLGTIFGRIYMSMILTCRIRRKCPCDAAPHHKIVWPVDHMIFWNKSEPLLEDPIHITVLDKSILDSFIALWARKRSKSYWILFSNSLIWRRRKKNT